MIYGMEQDLSEIYFNKVVQKLVKPLFENLM